MFGVSWIGFVGAEELWVERQQERMMPLSLGLPEVRFDWQLPNLPMSWVQPALVGRLE